MPFLRHLLVAVAAAGLLLTTARATADVEQHIPDDALVVFKINNMRQVNQRIAALAQEWGLAEMSPEMADPLGSFQRQAGITNGLREDGDMAIYLADHDLDGPEPPLVILWPVSDFDQFLENFQDVERNGDRAAGTSEDGERFHFRRMGNDFAAMTMTEELAGEVEQSLETRGITANRLDEKHMIVYANFRKLGPMMRDRMEEENARDEVKSQVRNALQQEGEEVRRFTPAAEKAVDQLFEMIERFLGDTEAATLGFDFTEDGIGVEALSQFRPDSYMQETFADMNSSQQPLLEGLPSGNYLFFGGGVADQELTRKLWDDFVAPVVNELREVEGGDEMVQYIETIRDGITGAGDARFGMFAPRGPLGTAALIQQFQIQEGDVQKLKQAARAQAELQPRLMAALGADEGDAPAVHYQPNAREIAGVQFDRVAVQFDDPHGMAAQQMGFLFGPEGPGSYMGEVDGKLLTFSGLTDEQVGQVIEAMRRGDAPLAQAQGVRWVNQRLPDDRSFVMYWQVDEALRTGLNYAQQMGFPMQVELPPDLPPIGVSGGPDDDSMRINMFVGKDLVSGLIVAALQLQQAFGGGPGGGL